MSEGKELSWKCCKASDYNEISVPGYNAALHLICSCWTMLLNLPPLTGFSSESCQDTGLCLDAKQVWKWLHSFSSSFSWVPMLDFRGTASPSILWPRNHSLCTLPCVLITLQAFISLIKRLVHHLNVKSRQSAEPAERDPVLGAANALLPFFINDTHTAGWVLCLLLLVGLFLLQYRLESPSCWL